ncbi:MAG: NAD-dependent protein deacetylase [Pyrodictiaceae archaeon]
MRHRLVEEAAKLIASSSYVVVFTGAGISTESGIPDFRGPSGLWKRIDPAKFSIEYFYEDPDEVWKLFIQFFENYRRARPNPAHYAIAELERIGVVKSVITQNVDGLHQAAGSRRVIELHGSLRYAVCINCGYKVSLEEAIEEARRAARAPRCPRCGMPLKPGVVFFGEALPRKALEEAFEEAGRADLVLVVGSSLTVYPAAYIPQYAKERGAKLLIINMTPTASDYIADLVIRGKAGEVLPAITREVKKLKGIEGDIVRQGC